MAVFHSGSRISSSHPSVKTAIKSPSPVPAAAADAAAAAAAAELDNDGNDDVITIESMPGILRYTWLCSSP